MMFSKKKRITTRDMQIKRDLNFKASKIAELERENTKLKHKLAQNTVKDCMKRADFIKPVPDLDERVSPTKEIDRPVSKKEPPKKYKRKVEIMQLCPPTVTNEKWNEIVQHIKQFFADVIGNNEIEQIVATPVNDGGVQYLIIYKEEVKE